MSRISWRTLFMVFTTLFLISWSRKSSTTKLDKSISRLTIRFLFLSSTSFPLKRFKPSLLPLVQLLKPLNQSENRNNIITKVAKSTKHMQLSANNTIDLSSSSIRIFVDILSYASFFFVCCMCAYVCKRVLAISAFWKSLKRS